MIKQSSTRVSVTIPESMLHTLDAMAKRSHCHRSWIIEAAIWKFITPLMQTTDADIKNQVGIARRAIQTPAPAAKNPASPWNF